MTQNSERPLQSRVRRSIRGNTSFIRDNLRWLAGGFLLTFFSSFGQTFFIGLSGNELRERFDLSAGLFGGLYAAATLMSALTLPWLGRTLDLMPGWKVARFSIPLLAAACVALALAPHLSILVLALYLLRLFGQGMMTHIALTETARWFVASRGRAVALVSLGVQMGSALLPAAFVFLEALGGLPVPWLAATAVLMLLGYPSILKLLSVERVPQAVEQASGGARTARDWNRREVLRDPVFYLLLIGILAPPFIGTTIFFHQGALIMLRGYDTMVFAVGYPLMAASTVLFGLMSGYLIDRFGARRILPFFLLPMATASMVVALIVPAWGYYLFMFLIGISNGFSQTLLGALWPEIYGLGNLGGIRAITVSAMVLATALGPGIAGVLMDMGVELPTQMLWMAGWCVLASFALARASSMVAARETMP